MERTEITSEQPRLDGVRHRYVELPGLRMHVAEAGSGDPVLLLHGFPQHWWEWRGVIPGLAEHYRVIAPDLRGTGWTDAPWPGAYTRAQLVADLVALLDSLGLDRVKLVSHDMGSISGFGLCLEHPERVDRHVSLGVPPPYISFDRRMIPAFTHLWFQEALAMPGLGSRLMRGKQRLPRHLFSGFAPTPESWPADGVDVYISRFRDPARARAASALYRQMVLPELGRIMRGAYTRTRLSMPTLLLFGAADAAFTPDLVPIMLRGIERHADHLETDFIDGAAHFIADEQPDEVVRRSLAFFGGVE